MGRLAFDSMVDYVYGSGGAHPGVVYATGPCRVVFDSSSVPLLNPLSNRVAYVTAAFREPNQPSVSSAGGLSVTDYSKGDVLAIPSGGNPNYQVLFVEKVVYPRIPPYFRIHVQPYGTQPPVGGCNGCAGSPSQWRCWWRGFGYAAPFQKLSFILGYTFGSTPDCVYQYNPPVGGVVTLTYPAVGSPVLQVGTQATYGVVGGFACLGNNKYSRSTFGGTFPKIVYLSPS